MTTYSWTFYLNEKLKFRDDLISDGQSDSRWSCGGRASASTLVGGNNGYGTLTRVYSRGPGPQPKHYDDVSGNNYNSVEVRSSDKAGRVEQDLVVIPGLTGGDVEVVDRELGVRVAFLCDTGSVGSYPKSVSRSSSSVGIPSRPGATPAGKEPAPPPLGRLGLGGGSNTRSTASGYPFSLNAQLHAGGVVKSNAAVFCTDLSEGGHAVVGELPNVASYGLAYTPIAAAAAFTYSGTNRLEGGAGTACVTLHRIVVRGEDLWSYHNGESLAPAFARLDSTVTYSYFPTKVYNAFAAAVRTQAVARGVSRLPLPHRAPTSAHGTHGSASQQAAAANGTDCFAHPRMTAGTLGEFFGNVTYKMEAVALELGPESYLVELPRELSHGSDNDH